jgi:hypothetical protein
MFSIGSLQKVWFGVHVTASDSEKFLDLALHYSGLVVLYTLIVLYTHGGTLPQILCYTPHSWHI